MRSLLRVPPEGSAVSGGPTLGAALHFVRSVWARDARVTDDARLTMITVAAPRASRATLLGLFEGEDGLLFGRPGEPLVLGLGAAAELSPSGTGRFAALRAEARTLLGRVDVAHAPGVPQRPARLYGGLSFFATNADHGEAFDGFGDGLFVLPRWAYAADDAVPTLSLTMPASPSLEARVETERTLASLWERLETPPSGARNPLRVVGVEQLSEAAWREQVEAILAEIDAGSLQKVVAARRASVALDRPAVAADVLARLDARFPGCTLFALRRGDATFLGATPETLVEQRHGRVTTEALAGSIALGRAAELLASDKDRQEHAHVVEAIVRGLAGCCDDIRAAGEPRIRELPNVLHLQTFIEARARDGVHVVDLVEALHPTPAVGGVPSADAQRFIATRERDPRGWYGAPFGYLDARGDGAFVVALRSGVLRGERAFVYAGAGIVRGSLPRAEYEETAMKMQALMGALDEDARA